MGTANQDSQTGSRHRVRERSLRNTCVPNSRMSSIAAAIDPIQGQARSNQVQVILRSVITAKREREQVKLQPQETQWSLFTAQSSHGVNTQGPACGQDHCKYRGEKHYKNDCGERKWIRGRDAVKQAAQIACERERS